MGRADRYRLSPWVRPLFWLLVGSLALVLLLLQADTRGIWQDEGLTLYQIRLPYPEILANQIPVAYVMTPNTVPPLFFLMLGTWGRLLGFDLWSLRLFSILCALLFIFLIYRVGRGMGDARLGRIAALLVAISPVLWWYAQELRMYAFLLVPAVISFGLLWHWYISDVQGVSRRTLLAIVLGYGVTAAVMLWTHYISFYLVAAQMAWLAIVMVRRHPKMVLGIGGTVLVVALPLIPFAIQRLGIGAERDFFFMPLHAIAADVVQSFALGTPKFVSEWEEIWWLLPFAWGLLGLGVWQAKRQSGWQLATLLGLGFVLPIVAVAAVGYIKPLYQNVRHAYVVAPAFYLLWALGLVRLYELRRWLPVVLILLFGYGWSRSTLHYFAPETPLKNDVRPLFETLARRYTHGDVIVLNDPVLQHSLQYFAPDVAWDVLPPYGEPVQDKREATYRAVANGFDRVWVVWGPPDSTHETWRELKDYYEEHYGRLDYLEFPGQTRIEAGLFDTKGDLFSMEPMEVTIPDDADFGDGMHFLGLARPMTVGEGWNAGQRVVIQTLWRADTMPTQNYQMVARLVDGAGNQWGQSQVYPYNGLHRTDNWLEGQSLRVPIFMDMPTTLPPATYYVTLHLVAPDGSPRYADGAAQPRLMRGNIPLIRPATATAIRGVALTDGIEAEAVNLPVTLPPATSLPLQLRLHLSDINTLPSAFRLSLQDGNGQRVWTQEVDPVEGLPRRADGTSDFPPSAWQAGDTFDLHYTLTFPPSAEGRFSLHLTALNGETPLPVPAWGGLTSAESASLGEVYITPRPHTFEVPPVAVEVNREWFNAVRLVGYTGSPDVFRADAPYELELVWQAIAPTDRPYKVFLHVLDENGTFVTGADGFLEVPSNAWIGEEITISRHRFEAGLVPPGRYTLLVGLYHEATGERLPMDAPDFAVTIGEVTVE